MTVPTVTLSALPGLPPVEAGDDLPAMLVRSLLAADTDPRDRDVLVIAQKIVSKAEGRLVDLATVVPSARASELAAVSGKDPRLVELILSESGTILRNVPGIMIVVHRLGLVMANAGIDQSNIRHPEGRELALLLPEDPDGSALRFKQALDERFGVGIGVVIADSFGRAWRHGVTGVAIGAAGLPSLVVRTGEADLFGRELRGTEIGFADEIAAAASLVMGQADEGLPAVLVRGLAWDRDAMPAAALIRPKERDLFR